MTDKKELGAKGEKFVVKHLKRNKYKILLRNYTTPYGEIDIIACNNENIVFVEVKTRTEGTMLPPRYAVDKKKRRRLIVAANIFLNKYQTVLQPRFDIAEVTVNEYGKMSVNYIEHAFGYKLDIYKEN